MNKHERKDVLQQYTKRLQRHEAAKTKRVRVGKRFSEDISKRTGDITPVTIDLTADGELSTAHTVLLQYEIVDRLLESMYENLLEWTLLSRSDAVEIYQAIWDGLHIKYVSETGPLDNYLLFQDTDGEEVKSIIPDGDTLLLQHILGYVKKSKSEAQ